MIILKYFLELWLLSKLLINLNSYEEPIVHVSTSTDTYFTGK